MRVIVQGRLVQRSYETKEGEKRIVVELQVDEIGPSLKYASAKVTRTPKSGGQASRPAQGDARCASARHGPHRNAARDGPGR